MRVSVQLQINIERVLAEFLSLNNLPARTNSESIAKILDDDLVMPHALNTHQRDFLLAYQSMLKSITIS